MRYSTLRRYSKVSQVNIDSPVPNNRTGGLNNRRGPTNNLNINKRGPPNKRGVWKLFSAKSGNQLPLIMGIALAKFRSARGASHQPAFMGKSRSARGASHQPAFMGKSRSARGASHQPAFMGKSRSARGASHQPAFMGKSLTLSHTCFPSHVFASFAFLMFSVFTFQEKWESLHSRLRQD